ncbi:MAG: iron-containing alcohol dehydrogenase [Verrucomicrobiales bacterium]
MNFEFSTANRILFGEGCSRQTGSIGRGFGSRALVVTGSNYRRHSDFLDLLESAGLSFNICQVLEEPTPEFCQDAASQAKQDNQQMVIAIGGGSALDAGKAIAALATNDGDIFDYLEIVGKGRPLANNPLPFIALPTTSGTGSEATRNAVLSSKKARLKVSLRSSSMFPKAAIVDPELTYGLPPEVTASTGMDALTQLLEAFTSRRANPLTDACCREGIPKVASSIQTAVADGGNSSARRNMALGSLLSGMALANGGLGAVHGFAAPIGGMFGAPHGMICASLLCAVWEMNYQEAKRVNSPLVERFHEAGRLLTGSASATADDAARWLKDLTTALKIKRLGMLGIQRHELGSILEPAQNSSSMKGNSFTLSNAQLEEILHAAW